MVTGDLLHQEIIVASNKTHFIKKGVLMRLYFAF
jgi:hypothetical protein